MREPLGDRPWDEDENGKDVLHLSNNAVSILSLDCLAGVRLKFTFILNFTGFREILCKGEKTNINSALYAGL